MINQSCAYFFLNGVKPKLNCYEKLCDSIQVTANVKMIAQNGREGPYIHTLLYFDGWFKESSITYRNRHVLYEALVGAEVDKNPFKLGITYFHLLHHQSMVGPVKTLLFE